MDYKVRYKKLNAAQKQAVDCINGPVMVIAGPGTGKTELLSMRAANILKMTDTLPENILCLTFTESGATAMRNRLMDIIGKDSYKVAVHTFHSFGVETINQNGEYFYQGAHFRPAEEIDRYEIVHEVLNNLDYHNPLAKKMNGEYTYMKDVLGSISELKKSGLTGDELLSVLDRNDLVVEKAEQLIVPVLANRITKDTVQKIRQLIPDIESIDQDYITPAITSLSRVMADSMKTAVDDSNVMESTKPITAWKNQWFKKDAQGNFILKTHERQIKLRALSYIYGQYLDKMQTNQVYDYDDMILRVVHAMEVFPDLRFNLQEKYQYIMVDEFQDTNMAQMRILNNLTNNPAQEDTPNIMVVGDDDQAIYSFQGADISNIINFRHNFKQTRVVTLTENYRSTADILKGARTIITQGHDRLETHFEELNKELVAQKSSIGSDVEILSFDNNTNERHFIVNDIKAKIKSGVKPSDIAVILRRHSEINLLLPYFAQSKIEVNYERRDNVLDLAPLKFIESLARLIIDLSAGRHGDANSKLPEILSHPAWGFEPIDI